MIRAFDKSSLRRAALTRRDALTAEFRARAAAAIAERALSLPLLSGPGPVGAYWPIRTEVDCRPLIDGLFSRGASLALPVVLGERLVFRSFAPGDPLEAAGFGTRGPLAIAREIEPRTLIVPLAAFDNSRHRIGYGKGHYDRAIEQFDPVATLGLAFDCQRVDEIPVESHDRRLDAIVTESAILAAA